MSRSFTNKGRKKEGRYSQGGRAYTNTDSMAFVQYQLEYGQNRGLTKNTGKKNLTGRG